MSMNIAIDGPAGAGKSTIAKAVAAKLGYVYVDTGAMYRAIALYVMESGVDEKNEAAVSELVADVKVAIAYDNGEQKVLLNGEDVSGRIRTEEVSRMASVCSVYPAVRAKLTSLQQEMAETTDLVMDGRDIGTAVLPNAPVKVYLTASVECRARRRYNEHLSKGEEADLEAIKKDIEERDYRDMHRETAPLKQADDAVLIDSSEMGIEEVKEAILSLVK